MRLALLKITFVLLTLSSMIQLAQAQTQNTIAPAPSDADLQNPNSAGVAPRLAPVPQIQPLTAPQNAQAQQQAMQQAAARAANPAMQQPVTPQLVPMNSNDPAQSTATVPVAAMPGQPAQTTVTSTTPVTTAPAAAQEAQAQQPIQATTTTGFSSKSTSNADTLPLNSKTMPVSAIPTTNPGMDMSINPNIVSNSGFDANPNAPGANTVPYEVQLQQRTQELQAQARDMAYEQAKKSVLPLETYEIRDVLGRLKDTQEAIQKPVRPAPKPSNTIETISTDPSATPKIIQLAAGNVTTLNIVDITGEPWPIVDLGFGGAFDVKPPEPGGHVIRITPLKDFARGNLVIRLLKMTTPITFTLQSGGDTVNYRFDARIPDYGPNAKMPLIDDGIKTVAGDKTTTAFLEGVPPSGADKLAVDGVDGRTSAYKYSGTLYIRTPLTLISPAWQGSATSADGMNVYVLTDAPVLLLSDKGALVRAHISDAKKETAGF